MGGMRSMGHIAPSGTAVSTFVASAVDAHAATVGCKAARIITRARVVQLRFRHRINATSRVGVDVGDGVKPEVDGSLFFTRTLATDSLLIRSQPTHVDPDIGSLKARASTLLPRPLYAGQPLLPFLCRGSRQSHPFPQSVARKWIERLVRRLRGTLQARWGGPRAWHDFPIWIRKRCAWAQRTARLTRVASGCARGTFLRWSWGWSESVKGRPRALLRAGRPFGDW